MTIKRQTERATFEKSRTCSRRSGQVDTLQEQQQLSPLQITVVPLTCYTEPSDPGGFSIFPENVAAGNQIICFSF